MQHQCSISHFESLENDMENNQIFVAKITWISVYSLEGSMYTIKEIHYTISLQFFYFIRALFQQYIWLPNWCVVVEILQTVSVISNLDKTCMNFYGLGSTILAVIITVYWSRQSQSVIQIAGEEADSITWYQTYAYYFV